jgi:hypothetical protein
MAADPDLERVEAELDDALRRLALITDRRAQIAAALQVAKSAGNSEKIRTLATQLDVVEARHARATAIAAAAAQRLTRLRQRVQDG